MLANFGGHHIVHVLIHDSWQVDLLKFGQWLYKELVGPGHDNPLFSARKQSLFDQFEHKLKLSA